ncbi:uncharacterized protein RMCC_3742 [Mycolicibacterium canariasense]|uniref:Uncharacterized protein n=2 Tax=Mycobacteriaceae TaxID=1762 RepID=A0A100WEH6_MYCCR|nr:uncharacterized protein RMCC_3742 [Mycolicibacterium canariasense]
MFTFATVDTRRAARGDAARRSSSLRAMKTPKITTKHTLLAASLLSIALAVPVAVAGAQPTPEPAAEQGTDAARPTPATLTVTATVAPGQCQPHSGGPAAVPVTDTAREAPAPGAAPAQPVEHVEGSPAPNATGAGTSRFDPYTCAPVPPQAADADASDAPSASALQGAPTAVIPSYTPTLNPYPGSSGGISTGGAAESSDPLSAPTTTATIPPAADSGVPTTTTAVIVPVR